MNLDEITPKHLNELEQQVKTLLLLIRKAKLQHEPLIESLRQLELELGEARRKKFDETTPEFRGY